LVKHYCRRSPNESKQRDKYKVIVKTPQYSLDNTYLNCPICGKMFKDLTNLKNHFKQKRKTDKVHRSFYNNQLKFKEPLDYIKKKKPKKKKSEYKPQFGKINIKKIDNKNK
jgi:hypothetical protein